MTEPEHDAGSEPARPAEPDPSAATVQPVASDDSTVGTGTFFAVGCSVLALLFVCVGVGIFIWRQLH